MDFHPQPRGYLAVPVAAFLVANYHGFFYAMAFHWQIFGIDMMDYLYSCSYGYIWPTHGFEKEQGKIATKNPLSISSLAEMFTKNQRWRISKIFCFSAHRQGKPNLWVKSFCLHFFRLDLGFGDGVGTLGKKKTAVFSDGSNKWVYGMGSEAHELNNFRHFHMFSYIFIIYIHNIYIYIHIHYRIIWKSL